MTLKDTKPPPNQNEYVAALESEFFRLREVERTLDATVDFLRSERNRLLAGTRELAEELREVRVTWQRQTADWATERVRLRAIESAAAEFHTAWQAVQDGLADFDLHQAAVERLDTAERELVAVLGGTLTGPGPSGGNSPSGGNADPFGRSWSTGFAQDPEDVPDEPEEPRLFLVVEPEPEQPEGS